MARIACTMSMLFLSLAWTNAAETHLDQEIYMVPFSDDCGMVYWSPDEQRVVYAKRNKKDYFELHLCNNDRSDDVCLSDKLKGIPHRHHGTPSYHPSGKWILCVIEKETHPGSAVEATPGFGAYNDLWVVRPDGSEAVQLTDVPNDLDHGTLIPRFSADGRKVVWSSRTERPNFLDFHKQFGYWELKCADFVEDGGKPRLQNIKTFAPGGRAFYESYGFSPDGTRIIFCSNINKPSVWDEDIYTIDAQTGRDLKRLTEKAYNEHAVYTPDGRHILWMSNAQSILGGTDWWIMKSDGSGKRRLTWFNDPKHKHSNGKAVWPGLVCFSNDGTRFLGDIELNLLNQASRTVVATLPKEYQPGEANRKRTPALKEAPPASPPALLLPLGKERPEVLPPRAALKLSGEVSLPHLQILHEWAGDDSSRAAVHATIETQQWADLPRYCNYMELFPAETLLMLHSRDAARAPPALKDSAFVQMLEQPDVKPLLCLAAKRSLDAWPFSRTFLKWAKRCNGQAAFGAWFSPFGAANIGCAAIFEWPEAQAEAYFAELLEDAGSFASLTSERVDGLTLWLGASGQGALCRVGRHAILALNGSSALEIARALVQPRARCFYALPNVREIATEGLEAGDTALFVRVKALRGLLAMVRAVSDIGFVPVLDAPSLAAMDMAVYSSGLRGGRFMERLTFTYTPGKTAPAIFKHPAEVPQPHPLEWAGADAAIAGTFQLDGDALAALLESSAQTKALAIPMPGDGSDAGREADRTAALEGAHAAKGFQGSVTFWTGVPHGWTIPELGICLHERSEDEARALMDRLTHGVSALSTTFLRQSVRFEPKTIDGFDVAEIAEIEPLPDERGATAQRTPLYLVFGRTGSNVLVAPTLPMLRAQLKRIFSRKTAFDPLQFVPNRDALGAQMLEVDLGPVLDFLAKPAFKAMGDDPAQPSEFREQYQFLAGREHLFREVPPLVLRMTACEPTRVQVEWTTPFPLLPVGPARFAWIDFLTRIP